MFLLDLASGEATNLTAVERVSFYNSGLFFWPGDPEGSGFRRSSTATRIPLDGRRRQEQARPDERLEGIRLRLQAPGRQDASRTTRVTSCMSQMPTARTPGGSRRASRSTSSPVVAGRDVVSSSRRACDCHPYVVAADGSGLRKLADRGGYKGVVEFLDVPDFHGGSSDVPVWSPTGSRSSTPRGRPNVEIFRATLDGQTERLTESPEGSLHYHPSLR